MKTLLLLLLASTAHAITIERVFLGGEPPASAVGGGSLETCFNAAADIWEEAIKDDWHVRISYRWENLAVQWGSEFTASKTNGRADEAVIFIDNSGTLNLYLDPNPWDALEFDSYTETVIDAGGGPLIGARYFYGPNTADASNRFDVFSMCVHEIGHALGMDGTLPGWDTSTSNDGYLHIREPLPFAGTDVLLFPDHSPHVSSFQVYGSSISGLQVGQRRWPSELDILCCAQVAQWRSLNLELRPTLHVGHQGGSVTLDWPAFFPSYRLQTCEDLRSGWQDVESEPVRDGKRLVVSVDCVGARKLYRLEKR